MVGWAAGASAAKGGGSGKGIVGQGIGGGFEVAGRTRRFRKGEQAEQLMPDGKCREGKLLPVLDLGASGFDDMTLDGLAVLALVDLDIGSAGWRTFEDEG
ncbi:MAG: hypothetical protein OXC95_07485 [Dehalococcoidia bacterium]|nr:hypothetical protein [Dehalococcoidia bacterium]